MEDTKVQPKTEHELVQDFVNEYNTLVQTHGYQIICNPTYKLRDDGSYSTVLQMAVGKLSKQE